MHRWGLGSISNVVLASLLCAQAAVVPPPWADPNHNPCASQPGGWQLIYWPADKKCYRIFQRGYPCPETMELSPGLDKGTPECNCPPGAAQHNVDGLCYPIFQQGPCEANEYFAPEPERADRQRLGRCLPPEPCTELNTLFHPRDKKCYAKFTKGPCPEGQLITTSKNSSLLGECRCETEEMSEFYWEPGGTCHQHFTIGPCQERGGLFLPGGQCGCHNNMPHFHNATSKCYQLGGLGPCLPGHHFIVKTKKYAECSCKEGYVKWSGDGACYRPYTRGPCSSGYMYSVNITNTGMEIGCVAVPCSTGKLYFPGGKGCHRVGTQGPCPPGQLVLFQDTVKTSVEGISYLGMCGCARYNQENTLFPTPFGTDGTNTCGAPRLNDAPGKFLPQISKPAPREDICINKRGMITWEDGTCRQLYAQGPCNSGEWVVPDRGKGQRQGRGWWKGKCECRPGYTVTVTTVDNENKTLCQAPTVVLAKFLNTKTNQYKYKNKSPPVVQDYIDENNNNNGNKIETGSSQPTNRYTTKLANVRNNSKITKLNTLEEHGRQSERTKLSTVRNNDDSYRRQNRYKANYEQHMRLLDEKKQKEMQEVEEKRNKEIQETEEANQKDKENNDQMNENVNKDIAQNVHAEVRINNAPIEKAKREPSDKKNSNVIDSNKIKILKEIANINVANKAKHADQETNNEVTKTKNISSRHNTNSRLNSKELDLENLSIGEQKLIGGSAEKQNSNERKGRKYNNNGNTGINSNEEEAYRNLKAIQDDINEYIKQQQSQDEQEERLKNHKLIEEDILQGNNDNERIDTHNERQDEQITQSGTEEFDTNVNIEVDENVKNPDEIEVQRIEDRRLNHREEDDFDEEGNSTETLIMVEDKKGGRDLSEYDHRKHIKDYVKPIIIFE